MNCGGRGRVAQQSSSSRIAKDKKEEK